MDSLFAPASSATTDRDAAARFLAEWHPRASNPPVERQTKLTVGAGALRAQHIVGEPIVKLEQPWDSVQIDIADLPRVAAALLALHTAIEEIG